MLPLGDRSLTRVVYGISQQQASAGDVRRGHQCHHLPAAPCRCLGGPAPHSRAPGTAQKGSPPGGLCRGQGLDCGRVGGQARGAAARYFPGLRRGRELVTPNDSPFSCLRPSHPPETPTRCQQFKAVRSSSAVMYTDIIAACAHCRPRGTGLPGSTFPQPFANPHRRENT